MALRFPLSKIYNRESLARRILHKERFVPLPSCIIRWIFNSAAFLLLKSRHFSCLYQLKSTQLESSYALIYLEALAEPIRLIVPSFTIEPSTASTVVGLTSGRI